MTDGMGNPDRDGSGPGRHSATEQRVVSLSVHKNTKDRRRRRNVRSDLVSSAKRLAQDLQPDGFAIVAYRHDPDGSTVWDSNYSAVSGMEAEALPAAAHRVLTRSLTSTEE